MKFTLCHYFYISCIVTILTQLPSVLGIQLDKVQPSNQGQLVIGSNYSINSSSSVRDKRQNGQARTFDFGSGPGAPASLCFEREVYGTCRYRTAPDECFRHEWTAYATIINNGFSKITSHPGDLLVYPGNHPRVRVYVKSSCCNPIVEFIAWDLLFPQTQVCIVDVRELQDLHPGEIAGIVIGALLFIIILIAIIACCVRRRRLQKERQTMIFGRSLTRSKSRSESVNPTFKT